MRIVAYQELGRLHTRKQAEQALAYVSEGLERFPRNPRLALQLSVLRAADWRASAALVERVEAAWDGDPGDSPRAFYELGREGELIASRDLLNREVASRLPALLRGLEVLALQPLSERPFIAECRGTLAW